MLGSASAYLRLLIVVLLLSSAPAQAGGDFHSADTDQDNALDLGELLRLVQFYNASFCHCDPITEDGFAPGSGDQTCPPHSADYLPQDWRISLSELLRGVQVFNYQSYHPCPESEDSFCHGEPGTEGQLEGNVDGALEGLVEGASEGDLEGVTEGSVEGGAEGSAEGSIEGTSEAALEGSMEGGGEGVVEGLVEGAPEGFFEGVTEGSVEGGAEGITEGSIEGNTEGIVEGAIEGATEGVPLDPEEFISIPAGTFEMGRPYRNIDSSAQNEVPVHDVYLDAYAIGKYEVTNQQMADVLNWAYDQGYLYNRNGVSYTGGAVGVYAHGEYLMSTYADWEDSSIEFSAGKFTVQSRTGYGGQSFDMSSHPANLVSWYGCVAYCNWRSEMEGLDSCYNFTGWSRYAPVRNGYRLPTEAEWERAAAWDGDRHWRSAATPSVPQGQTIP
jgi:hypothetical protein